MCVIKICKIFECWHLEAIFSVSRCEKALEEGLRYCNRACRPPILKAEFIVHDCSLCRSRHRSDYEPRVAGVPDPVSFADPDSIFLEFFQLNFPLMQLFEREDINTLIDPHWAAPIERARKTTMRSQAQSFYRTYPLLTPSVPAIEAIITDIHATHDHPEMEVLVMAPCDETCPGPHTSSSAMYAVQRAAQPPRHRDRDRASCLYLTESLYAEPMPASEIELLERWVNIAREMDGAADAGIEHVLPSMWDRRMRGLEVLCLSETIDDCVENGWLNRNWVLDNGLHPDYARRREVYEMEGAQGLVELQDWRELYEECLREVELEEGLTGSLSNTDMDTDLEEGENRD